MNREDDETRYVWLQFSDRTMMIVTRGGLVVDAADEVAWTIGKPDVTVLEHFRGRGARIVP